MQQKIWRRLSALILACLAGLLFALPAAAEEPGTVQLAATLTLSGTMPTDAAPYHFTLKAQNAANPMPADAEGDAKTVTVDKAGPFDFGSITFTDIGQYAYTVSQVKGSAANCTYDSRVYTATVYVQWKKDVGGPVDAILVLTVSGSDAKPDEIAFENVGVKTPPTATPTASPTPTATATTKPTPTATSKPTPTATTKPTPTASTAPSPQPTTTPVPTETPAPTATPEPTPAPTATPVPIGNGDGDTGGTNHRGSEGEEEWTTGSTDPNSPEAKAAAEKAALTAYLVAHGLLPQTSDDAPLLLWVILAAASLIALVVLLLRKRRKDKDDSKH